MASRGPPEDPPQPPLLVRARSAVFHAAADRRRNRNRLSVSGSVQKKTRPPRSAPVPGPSHRSVAPPLPVQSGLEAPHRPLVTILGKRTSANHSRAPANQPIRSGSTPPTCPPPPKDSTHRPPSSSKLKNKCYGTASSAMPANQASSWGGGGGAMPQQGSSSSSELTRVRELSRSRGGNAALSGSAVWRQRHGTPTLQRTAGPEGPEGRGLEPPVTWRPPEGPEGRGLEPPVTWRPADARLRSGGASRGSQAAPPPPLEDTRRSQAAPPPPPLEDTRSYLCEDTRRRRSQDSSRPPCRAAPFLSFEGLELESSVAPPPCSEEQEEGLEAGLEEELGAELGEEPQEVGSQLNFTEAVQNLIRSFMLLPEPDGASHANASHANASHADATLTNTTLAKATHANATHADTTLVNGTHVNATLANGTQANTTLVNGTHANATLANTTHAKATGRASAAQPGGLPDSQSAEPMAASARPLPISPGGTGAPQHQIKAAAAAAVPSLCLTLSEHQGALQHHANDDENIFTTRGKAEESTIIKHECMSGSGTVLPASLPASLPSAMPSASVCATQDSQPMDADCLQASNHKSASVGSVANQISAIHLTNHQPASLCPSPVAEERLIGGEQVGEEEEDDVPDELENDCSDDDDSYSIIDGLSCAVLAGMSPGSSDQRSERSALVPSLFPLLPPTLYFCTADEKVTPLPPEQAQMLKWKMTSVTPNVVRNTLARSHFRATKKSYDWLGCWGHHMKSPGFKPIREYQKLNHFPGSFQIGRKDRLWRNLHRMQSRFGRKEFCFFPRSFILPQDIKLLRKAWEEGGAKQKWIIKPPASARGIGIQVIHKWSQMPRKRPLLVQKYLHKPFLIGGNKFDLRIYVYVTSYDPLRIYVFSDGLVRFASVKYSPSLRTLGNKFMHLTNYSVNKNNSEYESNSDDTACQGHKWALKALWKYLGDQGIDSSLIWEKIKDIVIKTIIASDPYVNSLVKQNLRSASSCHELFGFDIMLDENLKPWLLEVNISPSLHSNTALDVRVKGQMIRDLLNLAGFQLPIKQDLAPPTSSSSNSSASSSTSSVYAASRERGGVTSDLSTDEKVKRAFYLTQRTEEMMSTVLDVLTPEDVKVLAQSEDELSRRGSFQRAFPSPTATARRYLRFFSTPRYLNILLDQWEARHAAHRDTGIELLRSLCQKGVHLGTTDPLHMWSKCSYVSRYEQRPHQPCRPKSSVVVRWSRSRLLDDDDDITEEEAEPEVLSPAHN